MTIYAIAGITSLLVAVGLTPIARHLALRFGLVDAPDARKVHRISVPRLGGVAIYAAFLVGTAAAVFASRWTGVDVSWERQGLIMLAAGFAVFLMGVLDDLYELPGKTKLLVLLAAAAAVCSLNVTIRPAEVTEWGRWTWLVSWSLTMLWIVGVTAAVNFIDGLDGLAAGIVALAGAALFLWTGWLPGSTGSLIFAAALVGALVGFLVYNRHPATIFMGDGGSMFVGFTIACISVLAAKQMGEARGLGIPAVALGVPLVDLVITVIRRRFVQRRSIFAAERGHIHHRLMETGLCHKHAVWLLYGVTVLAILIAVASLVANGPAAIGILCLEVPLFYGLFRFSGSARARGLVTHIRQTLARDREAKAYRDAAERTQLEFAQVHGFSAWWDTVCRAAERLDFTQLQLPLLNRDGRPRTLRWEHPDPELAQLGSPLAVTIPLTPRRIGDAIAMKAAVARTTTLESCAQRAGHFTRILEDFGLQNIKPATGTELDGEAPPEGREPQINDDAVAARPAPSPPTPILPGLKVAVVHDFLYTYAGAERVLEQILALVPQADLFSLFDFLPEGERGFVGNRKVTTSFLQKMPLARSKHRAYLPLMPLAIEQLDLSGYDLIISSSYMAAKGVITGPNQCHVCYCHSPVRYAWDLQHQYLNEAKVGFGPKGLAVRALLQYIRSWDARSARGVDHFIANSRFVKQRIEKAYRRDSEVIYPPVATHAFPRRAKKEDFYVTASRLVSYKRMDVVVEAFNRMPDKRLIVVGGGPELENLKAMAHDNVRIAGPQPFDQLQNYLSRAKAFVFAAEEDFGIVPVEAMACGTPVIAYGRGGALETVEPEETGLFFDEQSPASIIEAVDRFEAHEGWDAQAIADHADQFSHSVFHETLGGRVKAVWAEYARVNRAGPAVVSPRTTDHPSAAVAKV